jgi:hypothetical protein
MAEVCPDRSASYIASARRVLPHLRDLARNHPTVERHDDRDWPTWLVHGDAADATSELLLGLIALNEASPSGELTGLIDRFAEGVASMRLGSMNTFPYGLYASTRNGWHAWGNAQTQALAEAGWIDAARAEAESFFPRLIINGLIHSIDFAHPPIVRGFERIAYGARCVALGLLKVFEKTGEDRFAVMAGLAASWLMGNNATGVALYDPRTGRCFDAVESPEAVNRNAGAESTIEALYTLLEIGRHPAASRWLYAVGDPPVRSRCAKTGDELHYRVFRSSGDEGGERVAVVMNLTRETLDVRVGEEVDELLAAAGG